MLSTGAENVQDQFVTSTQRGQQHAQELSSRSAKTNATQQSSGDTNGDHSAHESANQKAPLSKRTSEIRCHFIKIKLNGCACPPVYPSGLPLRKSPMRPLVQVPKLTNQSTIAYSVVQKLVTGGVKMFTTSALEKTRQQREATTSLPIITTTHENFNHPFYVTGAGTTPADRGGCKIESSATSGDDTVPSKDHTQVTGRWQSPQTHPCADRPILSIDGRCLYKTGDQRHNKITTTKGCTIEGRTPRLLRFKKPGGFRQKHFQEERPTNRPQLHSE